MLIPEGLCRYEDLWGSLTIEAVNKLSAVSELRGRIQKIVSEIPPDKD